MKKGVGVVRLICAEAHSQRRSDVHQLAAFVARFFGRHRREKWPTVRQAARSLRWTQGRVQKAVKDETYGGRLLLASVGLGGEPVGDYFIEHLDLIQVVDPMRAKWLRTGGMKA